MTKCVDLAQPVTECDAGTPPVVEVVVFGVFLLTVVLIVGVRFF